MIIEVSVVPNSKRFSVSVKDGRMKICLKSAPEHNKANLELVKELSKLLGCDVRLVGGQKSKRKTLEVSASEKEWGAFLARLERER